MNPDETMVENFDNSEAEDEPIEDVVEEESEPEAESLDTITGETGETEEEPPEDESTGAKEPGYVRKRIDKAVSKAVAETEARMRAEFDTKMQPILERMLNDEAKDLVRQGEFKSLDRAKEYLRLKQGLPTPSASEAPKQQTRNASGQFAAKAAQETPAEKARIEILSHQAAKIKTQKGVDVMAEFQSNEEIKQKVISGKMDFYDVLDEMTSAKGRKAPAPTRSPNGASGKNPNAIDTMSDEQFARMEKKIKEGARYTLR